MKRHSQCKQLNCFFFVWLGAGFYLTATEEKWVKHYNMFDYVTKELRTIVNENFSVLADRQSISGHSMGGHGALICALKNPGLYRSASAFAPIANPVNAPWGKKAFTGYLGSDQEKWKQWDATELVQNYEGPDLHFLIDQGLADKFYPDQLQPENFKNAVAKAKQQVSVNVRLHEGYDHSYFFVTTFIDDHLRHHASFLN
eukprot:TRINITY_DN2495_c0_g1_i3.p1 TRINITY_DN2495_c0_g1~~TRINITY_DN2495_c0_g1_i3.p1  ORF type:complete len:200 (-),score=23.69 TRINITY_DN2495_c0_g1_i3:96-695(-)